MTNNTTRVVIAPPHQLTRIKEVLDKQGNIIKTEVVKPK